MKKYILMLFSVVSFLLVNAQRHPARDTTRHWDTSFTSINESAAKLIHAPVLTSTSQQHQIIARQQFCFDIMMEVELNFGRISRYVAVFINTTDGYIGYTPPTAGGSINIVMPEIESFVFTIMSYKLGNIYMYHNQKASRGDGIDHLITTSNTNQHDYQEMNNLTAAPLNRKTERRSYVYGTMNAQAYKRSDEPTIWFINTADYRSILPPALTVQKILGAFGVGVVQTDFGSFILCERTNGTSYTKITNIERCHVCFDPSGFKMTEADFYTKQTADIRAEREKINQDQAEAQRAESCVSERMQQINYRREMLQVQEDNLLKAQSGNLIQDNNAQKGMLGMMDYNAAVHSSILATKTTICNIEYGIGHRQANEPDNGAAERLSCQQQILSNLMITEGQMQAIDARYNTGSAMDLVRRNAEKARIYSRVMQAAGCN